MTAAAWLTLAVVCGFIWGGALTLLAVAVRKEGRKRRAGPESPGS